MAFKDYIRKKRDEFKQEAAASAQIRKKARAAGYQEREKQEIRLAQEREKIRTDKKIKQYKTGGSKFGSFLDSFGGAPMGQQRAAPRRTTKRKGKKRKAPRRAAPRSTSIFDSGGFI